MKANEIRKMNAEQLNEKLTGLKKDLFMLRMQHATNQLDNPVKIREVPFFFILLFYSSQLFTVLGNGITSRMLDIPVRYMMHLSNPSPNPACLVDPYFLRSR